MNARSVNWLPFALVVSIAAISLWLQQKAADEFEKPPSRTTGTDFWAENFTIKRFGPDGTLQHILAAQRMTHESSDDSSILEEPRLSFQRIPPLTVSARKAYVSKGSETVDFEGDVRLDRAGGPGGKAGPKTDPLHVRTEQMTVYPDREQARGNVPVRIEKPGSVATASSYRVDGKSGVSILEGRVRATLKRNTP